jgi:hypothetical protein
MKHVRSLAVLVTCFLAIPCVHAQTQKITAAEAKNHIGDRVTVCGKVASTHYAKNSKGEPTFLNLDEPYPKEIFTILIWGSDRVKFGTPESEYKALQVCVRLLQLNEDRLKSKSRPQGNQLNQCIMPD